MPTTKGGSFNQRSLTVWYMLLVYLSLYARYTIVKLNCGYLKRNKCIKTCCHTMLTDLKLYSVIPLHCILN